MAQTPDGYLWMSTGSAAYRFDGLRFELWIPPPDWAARLTDQLRGCPLVTRDGTLWMAVGDGLARIRGKEFAWMPIPMKRLRLRSLSLVEEDETNLLVIADADGLYRVNRDTGAARRLSSAEGIPAGMPRRLWTDRDGTIWLAHRFVSKGATGLFRDGGPYAAEDTVLYKPRGDHAFHPTGVRVGQPSAFAQTADGTIWLSETSRSVRIFRSPDGRYFPPGPEIRLGAMDLVVDRHGSLWIPSLGDGLRRVPAPRDLGTRLVGKSGEGAEAFTEDHGLSGDVLYAAFEDREGNLWFAGTNGLDRFRPVRLADFTAKEGVRLNMDERAVLAPDDQAGVTVLTPTLHGLVLHVDRSGQVKSEAVYENTVDGKGCVGVPGRSSNALNVVYRAPDGMLWAAGTRLFMRIQAGWKCIRLGPVDGSLEVSAMAAASGGGLWLGSGTSELWRYHPDGSVTRVAAGAGTRKVTVVFEQEDGTVWFGGSGGLAALRGHDVVRIGEAEGLAPGGVYALFTNSHDELWVLGPKGLGLLRDGRVAKPGALDRLPLVGCWSGVRDGSDIWFTCRHGLVRIASRELYETARNPGHSPEYELFNGLDDLRSMPIRGGTNGSIARSGGGRIWFLTQKGLGYVDPQRLDRPRLPPTVYVDSAQAGSIRLDVGQSPRLKPLSNALNVSFNAVSLGHPEGLNFRYRLEGADEDWKETRERSVSFSHLAAGHYRLRIRAADYLGVWSRSEAVWSFSIAPHWYETWWFWLSVTALVAALIWLAVRVGLGRQAANLKREFAVQLAERTRIAGELHDTLLQGFQGTTMELHALAGKMPPGSPERTRLSAVLGDVQTVLSDGRKAIWAIRESTTTGPDLSVAFARVAAHVDVSTPAFRFTEEGEPQSMNPVQRDILYQLGREALINAFQHSGAQLLHMHLSWDSRSFRMIVRDDGVGIPDDITRAGRQGHFGLAGMRERGARLGAEFELRTGTGRGTEISVSVPARAIYLHPTIPWYRTVISRLASIRSHRA